MKRIQPVVIVPFGFIIGTGIVGLILLNAALQIFLSAVDVVAGRLCALFNSLLWLSSVTYYCLCYGGGLALIIIGIYFLINTFWNWPKRSSPNLLTVTAKWSSLYLLTIAAGLFIFSLGFNWAYSDKYTKIVSVEQHVITTVKWFFWKDSHIETTNIYGNTWWFAANKIIRQAGFWIFILCPSIFAVEVGVRRGLKGYKSHLGVIALIACVVCYSTTILFCIPIQNNYIAGILAMPLILVGCAGGGVGCLLLCGFSPDLSKRFMNWLQRK